MGFTFQHSVKIQVIEHLGELDSQRGRGNTVLLAQLHGREPFGDRRPGDVLLAGKRVALTTGERTARPASGEGKARARRSSRLPKRRTKS